MFNNQKVVVMTPAYNAVRMLKLTYQKVMTQAVADLIILMDDASRDETVAIAKMMNQVKVPIHGQNPRAYLFALVMVFFDARSNQ